MKRSKPIRRSPVKRVNRQRKAKNFARAYGSPDRAAFVQALPCAACGVVGFSENAHVASGGAGRKADASQIVPLCRRHQLSDLPHVVTEGCHEQLHRVGRTTFERLHGISLARKAELVEAEWRAVVASRAEA